MKPNVKHLNCKVSDFTAMYVINLTVAVFQMVFISTTNFLQKAFEVKFLTESNLI